MSCQKSKNKSPIADHYKLDNHARFNGNAGRMGTVILSNSFPDLNKECLTHYMLMGLCFSIQQFHSLTPFLQDSFSQPSKCRLHNEIPDTYTVIGL